MGAYSSKLKGRRDRKPETLRITGATAASICASDDGRHGNVVRSDSLTGVSIAWLATFYKATGQFITVEELQKHMSETMGSESETWLEHLERFPQESPVGAADFLVLVHPCTPWPLLLKTLDSHFQSRGRGSDSGLREGHAGLVQRPSSQQAGKATDIHQGSTETHGHVYLHFGFLHCSRQELDGWVPTPDHVSACMASMTDPALLLVIDPAGAIFTDPRTAWAAWAALHSPHPHASSNPVPNPHSDTQPLRDTHQRPSQPLAHQDVASELVGRYGGGSSPRLTLASALSPADWPRVAEAFSRMALSSPAPTTAATTITNINSPELPYMPPAGTAPGACCTLRPSASTASSSTAATCQLRSAVLAAAHRQFRLCTPVMQLYGSRTGPLSGGTELTDIDVSGSSVAALLTCEDRDALLASAAAAAATAAGAATVTVVNRTANAAASAPVAIPPRQGQGQAPQPSQQHPSSSRPLDPPASPPYPPGVPLPGQICPRDCGAPALSLKVPAPDTTFSLTLTGSPAMVTSPRSPCFATPAPSSLTLPGPIASSPHTRPHSAQLPLHRACAPPYSHIHPMGLTCVRSASELQEDADPSPTHAGTMGRVPVRIGSASKAAGAGPSPMGCGWACTGMPDTFAPAALEAARRYSALLDGAGRWAAAEAAARCCVGLVGSLWGHRSAHMAHLRAALGRLQGLQGLHAAAEVSWRQAVEAYECTLGPSSPATLGAQVQLALALAALDAPGATPPGGQGPEDLLRSALTALDGALGPHAPETLAARRALAAMLVRGGRWAEAEVLLQGLLAAVEKGQGSVGGTAGKGSIGANDECSRRLGSAGAGAAGERAAGVVGEAPGRFTSARRAPSRRASELRGSIAVSGLVRGPSRVALLQDLQAAAAGGAGSGGSNSGEQGGATLPGGMRKDSPGRLAWTATVGHHEGSPAAGPSTAATERAQQPPGLGLAHTKSRLRSLHSVFADDNGDSNGRSSYGKALTAPVGSVAFPTQPNAQQQQLPPASLLPSSTPLPSLTPVPNPKTIVYPGVLNHGQGDALQWAEDALALAEVVVMVQREQGGDNPLYQGVQLVGPESAVSGLGPDGAVCNMNGACISAMVSIRRLTDAGALCGAALAAARNAVGREHPRLAPLLLQQARCLGAAGDIAGAVGACWEVLMQWGVAPELMVAPDSARSRDGIMAESVDGEEEHSKAALEEPQIEYHPEQVDAWAALGAVLGAGGRLPEAGPALREAAAAAEQLVAGGDMAAGDGRRIAAIGALADVLWQQAEQQGAPCPRYHQAAALRRQQLDLTAVTCGPHHERVLAAWVSLGRMAEAVGQLAEAERAYCQAGEVSLHRHGRLSRATKDVFLQLQRVYRAQGRAEDAEVLGHMYRLQGGLLSGRAQ